MLLPEFCEELFYTSNSNLFEPPFKIYLQKVFEYNILETQKWLKQLNKNYTVKQLKNLQRLDLENNQLTYIPTLTLPNLRSLYLNNNQLTSFQNFNLPNLRSLYLYNNQLTTIPSFTLLPNLQILYIYNNQLTTIPSFTLLPNLQILYIFHNKLTETSKKYIKSLNIKDLWL